VTITSVHDLRRIADAVEHLRNNTVVDVLLRADCRQLRVSLEGGQMLLISVLVDENGKARIDADLLRPTEEVPTGQLEVEFERAD